MSKRFYTSGRDREEGLSQADRIRFAAATNRPRPEIPRVSMISDWQPVRKLLRQEKLLAPSSNLKSRLSQSLAGLPPRVAPSFPGTFSHWLLLSGLLLPVTFVYAALFGFLAWVWRHPDFLLRSLSLWLPEVVLSLVQRTASFQSGRRTGLVEGVTDQVRMMFFHEDWQFALITVALTVAVVQLTALFLLIRVRRSNSSVAAPSGLDLARP